MAERSPIPLFGALLGEGAPTYKEEAPEGSATGEHRLIPTEDVTYHIHGRGLQRCQPFT